MILKNIIYYINFKVQNESDAILKLKESMQEETKRFEKQNHELYSD